MIKEFISQWWKNKDNMEHYFRSIQKIESVEYKDIVKALIENVLNVDAGREYCKISTDIHVIDDGDYQGTQIFVVHNNTYQPDLKDYFFADNYYGSCSGCDTLMSITVYSDEPATEEQIKELMTLAFDLLRSFKPFVPNATYRGLPIHLTEEETKLNLNKCKFGDKLRTRDGRMAVFLNELAANLEVYVCVIKNDEYNLTEMMYRANGKSYYHDEPSEFDITGRWVENPIVDILLRGSSLIIKNNEGTINIS